MQGRRGTELKMPFTPTEYWDRSINNWIPQGDHQAFKIALYNAMVLAFLACCIAVVGAVFCLLQAVLKSMLWAILCGTVLFPFKYRLTAAIEGYLRALKESGTPLFIGIAVAPLAAVDRGAEALWSAVVSKSALTLLAVYVTAAAVTYESNFTRILTVGNKLYNLLDSIIWLYSCGPVSEAFFSRKWRSFGKASVLGTCISFRLCVLFRRFRLLDRRRCEQSCGTSVISAIMAGRLMQYCPAFRSIAGFGSGLVGGSHIADRLASHQS